MNGNGYAPHPRICDSCGDPYWRRNRMELWLEGSDGVPRRVEVRRCLKCQSGAQSRRLMMVAHVTVTKKWSVRPMPKTATA